MDAWSCGGMGVLDGGGAIFSAPVSARDPSMAFFVPGIVTKRGWGQWWQVWART